MKAYLTRAALGRRSRFFATAAAPLVSGFALVVAACAVEVPDDTIDSSRDSLSFEAPGSFSELKGLAPRPTRTTTTVAALQKLVGAQLPEFLSALATLHGQAGQVRIVESFSSANPLVLSSTYAMAPYADGVFEAASLPSPAALDQETACAAAGTHVCEQYYDSKDRVTARDVLVLVGKRVELSADVKTDGRSLLIIADEFASNGFTIDTAPMPMPKPDPTTSTPATPPAAGSAGVSAGHVAIVAARVESVRVTANGDPGVTGVAGTKGGPGASAFTTSVKTVNDQPTLVCNATDTDTKLPTSALNPVNFATPGGAGGAGGNAGRLFVSYTRFVDATGAIVPLATRSQESCFGACTTDSACALDPSVVACDLGREVDNARCSDGMVNAGRGPADCASTSCKASPFATVCRTGASGLEGTVEACSDGRDNDGNGKTDCADPRCATLSVCDGTAATTPPGRFRIVTTGYEESTNASCADGLDNDADGNVDCADSECLANPLVTVCGGGEKTLEACSNRRDDDGDGKVDCADPGCAGNPYVLVCGSSPFLRESTNARCSDRTDNDEDKYVDCKDYGCQNNPLVTVCGRFENSLALCTNGRDDDGDGKVDCADPHCWFNPFFGDYACRRTTKTRHTQVAEPASTVAGVNGRADVVFTLRGGAGGASGPAGVPLGKFQTVRFPWGVCDPAFDPSACYDVYDLHCQFGPTPAAGAAGTGGTSGAALVKPISRRTVDVMRIALSPRQLSVTTAQANALFKRNDATSRARAAQLYLDGEIRARGALLEAKLDCITPHTTNAGLATVQGAACASIPALDRGLGRLRSGLDFFGDGPRVPVNPLWRYTDQRASLLSASTDLAAAFQAWISLSAALDGQTNLQAVKARLDSDAASGSRAVDGANARIAAASARVDDIKTRIDARRQALALNRDAIDTTDARIRAQYAQKSIGDLASDLLSTALTTFGGKLLEQAMSDIGNELLAILKSENTVPASAPSPAPSAPGAQSWLDKLWKTTKDNAQSTVENDAVKGAATQLGTSFQDILNGTVAAPPERSLVATEVERVLLDGEQRRIAMEAFDLTIALRQAVTELEIAKLDGAHALANHAAAALGSAKIAAYLSRGANLDAHEITALGQTTYARALGLVEEVTVRYRRLLRQAQYEALPYNDTGKPLFKAPFGAGFDVNIRNFPDVTAAVRQIDDYLAQVRPGSGTAATYSTTLQASAFKPATSADLALLRTLGALGIPGLDTSTPLVASVDVTPSVLANIAALAVQKNVRLDDVRASWQGSVLAPSNTFVALTPTDTYRVRRPAAGDLYAGFDIVAQAVDATSGTVIGSTNLAAIPACSASALPIASNCGIAAGQGATNVLYGRSAMNRYVFVIPGNTALPASASLAVEFSFRGALLP